MGFWRRADTLPGNQTPLLRTRAQRWLLYGLYCAVVSYVLTEAVYSSLYVWEYIEPPRPDFCAYIIENTGGSSGFDPICGIRLSSTPCRHARITGGMLGYAGIIRRNNHGFPDRDDFGP